MALFARSKEAFLREIVAMEYGPPSHDTFSRVFRQLEPEPFEAAFMAFTRAFSTKLAGVVAIDGKALKGAYERGARSSPLHLVNVWAAEARFAVAQRLAPGRGTVRNLVRGAIEVGRKESNYGDREGYIGPASFRPRPERDFQPRRACR